MNFAGIQSRFSMMKKIPNIVIFASGSGSNAENIINWSKERKTYTVTGVFCNRKDAYVLTRAERLGIPHWTFTGAEFRDNTLLYKGKQTSITAALADLDTDYVILAGFLLKVPGYLLEAYPERILNIHPALLPSYGGKGMYGDTIHVVDSQYDHGKTVYQARCTVTPEDTPETLFAKVHELERAYPEVIEDYVTGKI